MAVRPTLQLGNPLLRQAAQPIDDVNSAEIQALLADLWDTLRDFRQRHGWGRALSAPVIGVPLRAIVVDFQDQQLVLINPRFERWSREQEYVYESCITFGAIWGAVYRPTRVTVVALDADGLERRYEATGPLARMMQHEIDHLDGLVWLDREPDLASICTTDEYRRQQGQAQLEQS
ncbi:MAG TPA: peptide deformylase [Herpetosiphonaceae bacterium]